MQNDPFGFDPPEENQPPPATRKPIEGFDDVRGEVTVREKWDHGADIEEEIEKIHERKVTVRNWGMIKLFRRELYRRKNREPCTTSGQRGIAKKAEVRLTVMVKAFIALLEAIKQNYDSLLEEVCRRSSILARNVRSY